MSDLKKLLGKRIKEIRLSRKMTQEQLSELTDIGTSSISKIESGYFHPTDENLERIAKALNIQPYKLYMFNHNKNTKDLLLEINNLISLASDDEIKIIYRILSALIDK